MVWTRTQKLRWAAAKNNLQMPKEGLTCISNPSSHTIFVIGQQVAQWHFYVWFFSQPTLISASILTFCLLQMSTAKPTRLPHGIRPALTHFNGQNLVISRTLFCIFSTTAHRYKEESWKVYMAHFIQKCPMDSCNFMVHKEWIWQVSVLHTTYNFIKWFKQEHEKQYIHVYKYISIGKTFGWYKQA